MYAGWEESEPSDSDSNEEGAKLALHDPNICFMAYEQEVISDTESESFYMQCDLATALEELNIEFKRMSKEFSSLKKLHASCDVKLEQLQTFFTLTDELLGDLDFENKQLRSKIERLEIESGRIRPTHAYANYHHRGRNRFHRSYAPTHKRNFVCTYCMKRGHISTHCRIKDNHDFYGMTWVPKGTKLTNHQGSKIWVPKVTTPLSLVENIKNTT